MREQGLSIIWGRQGVVSYSPSVGYVGPMISYYNPNAEQYFFFPTPASPLEN